MCAFCVCEGSQCSVLFVLEDCPELELSHELKAPRRTDIWTVVYGRWKEEDKRHPEENKGQRSLMKKNNAKHADIQTSPLHLCLCLTPLPPLPSLSLSPFLCLTHTHTQLTFTVKNEYMNKTKI